MNTKSSSEIDLSFSDKGFEVLWPLETLQSLFGSITPHKLVLIAGRPGSAKGILAYQLALYNAPYIAVLYIDTRPNRTLMSQTNNWSARLEAKGVDTLVVPNLTLAEIEQRIREQVAQRGLGLVVLNTLQEVLHDGNESDDDEHSTMDYIVRTLKGLALDLGIVIVCVSQVAKDADKNPGIKPELSHLLGSIALAYTSDQIYFLWRDGSLKMGQSKNRTGPEQRNTVALELDQSSWQLRER